MLPEIPPPFIDSPATVKERLSLVEGFIALSRQNQHALAWLIRMTASPPPTVQAELAALLALERQREVLLQAVMSKHYGLQLASCCPPIPDAISPEPVEVTP
jgi:hypothetical protein